MSEFDFEELDKAVNQLMSKTDTNQTQTETAVPVTSTSSVPSPAPVALPKADQVIPPAPIVAVQPPAQPLVSPRGQFMDVKPHTETNNSVSMMPTRHEPAVIASPGLSDQASIKQGPLVQDILPPDVKSQQGVSSQSATAPSDQSSNIDQSTVGTEQPDPLEATIPEGLQPQAEQSSTEPSKPPEFKPDFPLFVPDAKVEKRPLGGAPNKELDSKTISSAIGEIAVPSSEETPHDLPAELGQDILSIESKDTTAAAIDTPKPKPNALPSESSDPTAPTMAVSISQQYKETPSSGDESHTALYETASYTPLQHPAKKKSGWLVVMIIISLLLVCGAVAAALYYLHIL